MRATLVNAPITAATAIAAVPSSLLSLLDSPRSLSVQGTFAQGTGGTSCDAYLQTSLDGGLTWIDIANFHFTTSAARFVYNLSSLTPKTTEVVPSDGTLTANTSIDGVLGSLFQVKTVSVGTYVGANLRVDVSVSDR